MGLSILWFLIPLLAVPAPTDTGVEKVPVSMAAVVPQSRVSRWPTDLAAARWRTVAQGVAIKFVLHGLAGIEYWLHSSRNGLSTNVVVTLSGSRQEPAWKTSGCPAERCW